MEGTTIEGKTIHFYVSLSPTAPFLVRSFALYACSMLLRGIFLLLYSLNATGETFMRFQTMRNRSEIGATESDVSRPLWANFLVADWTSIANWGKMRKCISVREREWYVINVRMWCKNLSETNLKNRFIVHFLCDKISQRISIIIEFSPFEKNFVFIIPFS